MTSWEIDGAEALRTYAPDASAAYDRLVEIRPIRVHDEVLQDPAVAAFAEQFGADLAEVGEGVREALEQAAGGHLDAVVRMVWIGYATPRLRTALDAVFTPSQWESPRRFPVNDVGVVIGELVEAVDALGTVSRADAAHDLVDAMLSTPVEVGAEVVDGVRRELTPAQAVVVILDAVRHTTDRIASVLRTDEPEPAPEPTPPAPTH